MFVLRLNDAHLVGGGVGKRQEDRNNEKYGLDLQREITIIREWWNVNTYSLKQKRIGQQRAARGNAVMLWLGVVNCPRIT